MMPAYTIRTRPTPGAPYTIHSIVLADGRTVYEQLGPYGPGEAEERIRDFLKPTPPSATVVRFNSRVRLKRGDSWRPTMHFNGNDPEAA